MRLRGLRACGVGFTALVVLALSIVPCSATQEETAPPDGSAALAAEADALLERIDQRREEIAE